VVLVVWIVSVTSTDRYAAYSTIEVRRRIYWAHRKRDIQSLLDAGGDGAWIGERLMASLRDMFHRWIVERTFGWLGRYQLVCHEHEGAVVH
jgi:hypothetical protein